MTQHSDNEIIKEVLKGNTHWFEQLVKKYETPLFIFVGNLIKNTHQTEDLVQDVFLSAFKHLKTFNPEKSRFSTWLYRIARNACFNELKKKKEIVMETLPEPENTNVSHDPSTAVILKESFLELDKALNELDKDERILFVLSEIKELSYQEVADIENIKLGTLKSRLYRAKTKIRKRLKAYMSRDKMHLSKRKA